MEPDDLQSQSWFSGSSADASATSAETGAGGSSAPMPTHTVNARHHPRRPTAHSFAAHESSRRLYVHRAPGVSVEFGRAAVSSLAMTTHHVLDPCTAEAIATFELATADDVDAAVERAKATLPAWKRVSTPSRDRP